MQNLPHRRYGDAGLQAALPQAASHSQVPSSQIAPVSFKPIDSTETVSSETWINSTHTSSDDALTASFIVRDVQARLSGRVPGPEWSAHGMTSSGWDILRRLLKDSVNHDKLRYDYFPGTQTFVHRMPSHTHDLACNGFAQIVLRELTWICHGAPEKQQFLRNAFLCCRGNGFYGLVIEVAYAQKSKQLEKLAQFYLFDAHLNTQKVVGIAIDYDRSKRVTLHTWQRDNSNAATSGRIQHYSQEVRTETGARVSGPPLQISVFDIAPPSLVPSSLHGVTIPISLEGLCDDIELGEDATTQRERYALEKARRFQTLGGLDCNDCDSSEEGENETNAGTRRVDEDYVLSRAGLESPESGLPNSNL
ncbi:hypothetical protein AYL99_11789 [Fonsecaea erecta]|uniref:Uncharacterized protein n=1 Tax=Fonsecaea erecta TaxID=1367422 RepID=A0A178Z2K2_9EURO|nr:hypothetical protein AYL99_11789 [Fonsecaea erecta]OAP54029.1 hypothetical protein AYL99_11789 [Fonsecaea erecta]